MQVWFPQPLVNETHLNIETRLLHKYFLKKWLNNANPLDIISLKM